MIATLLLFLAGTWTVDSFNAADFKTIQAAIDSPLVADGDTVFVQPGGYPSFTLDRRLTIVGRAGAAQVIATGQSVIDGAPSFTISGLQMWNLTVQNVPGRGRIDDCSSGGIDYIPFGDVVTIRNCAQIELTRTYVIGHHSFSFDGTPAVTILDSRVTIADCVLVGGDGSDSVALGQAGYAALEALGESDVLVAGSSVTGGRGGCSTAPPSCAAGGAGIRAVAPAAVVVRGSSTDQVNGGFGSPRGPSLAGSGTITWSGATAVPPPPPLVATQVVPAEPYLELSGGPVGTRQARLYGQPGTIGAVFTSLGTALSAAPGVDGGLVWIDPAQIVDVAVLVALGQDVPATKSYALPPSLGVGTGIAFQGALLPTVGKPFVTNVTNVIMRR